MIKLDVLLEGIFMTKNDTFYLYDLKVEVIQPSGKLICTHSIGSSFTVEGENLVFTENTRFSLYALSALLPLFPAKQRETDPNDWITSDEIIACPDPNCGGRFKITRLGKRKFSHSETTAVPVKSNDSSDNS